MEDILRKHKLKSSINYEKYTYWIKLFLIEISSLGSSSTCVFASYYIIRYSTYSCFNLTKQI